MRRCLHKLASLGYDYERQFKELDRQDRGYIGPREFMLHMTRLGLMLTEGEIRALMHKYDVRGDGVIRYREFLDLAQEDLIDLDGLGLVPPRTREKLEELVVNTGSVALRRIFSKGSKTDLDMRDIRKLFIGKLKQGPHRTLDKDDLDGLLPCFELDAPGRVLFGPLVDFSLLCCGDWAAHKRQGETGFRDTKKSKRRNRSGSWSDDDEGSEGPKMEAELQARMARVAYKARMDAKKMTDEFKSYDKSKDGSVTVKDFKRVLEQTLDLSSDDLSKSELKGLVKRFDPCDNDQVITSHQPPATSY